MTLNEAKAIGSDLLKLAPTVGPMVKRDKREAPETNRQVEGTDLVIMIQSKTDGEPYREGIRFEVRRVDYSKVLCMDLDSYDAHQLAIDLGATPQ